MTKLEMINQLKKVNTPQAKKACEKLASDLKALTIKDIKALLPIENSKKEPTTKKEETPVVEPRKTVKKTTKKVIKKSKEEPKEVKKPLAKKSKKTTKAKEKTAKEKEMFPQVIKFDSTELVRIDEFTLEDLKVAFDSDKTIYIATHWLASDLKEFNYAESRNVKCPKKFEYDLDITQVSFICENNPKTYAISLITEACFEFTDEDLLTHNQIDLPLCVYLEREEV